MKKIVSLVGVAALAVAVAAPASAAQLISGNEDFTAGIVNSWTRVFSRVSTFSVVNSNTSNTDTNLGVTANSGANSMVADDDVQGSGIETGDVTGSAVAANVTDTVTEIEVGACATCASAPSVPDETIVNNEDGDAAILNASNETVSDVATFAQSNTQNATDKTNATSGTNTGGNFVASLTDGISNTMVKTGKNASTLQTGFLSNITTKFVRH